MRIPNKLKVKLDKVIATYIATGEVPLTELSSGAYRLVFGFSRDYVLKIETGYYFKGKCLANKSEYRTYKRNPKNKARCMLVPKTNGKFLLMERVYKKRDDLSEFTAKEKIPNWVYRLYDRVQCGYNKKGQLVRYDYQSGASYY